MENEYLIIGGSEKSGTTSLYQYLLDSNLFIHSKTKETDFFRQSECTSIEEYQNCFVEKAAAEKPYLEASPGYLADSKTVAGNIPYILKNYHLVFCLRNPIDRLISSYIFHKSRLYLPSDMSFEFYFDECIRFEEGHAPQSNISEWCLRVPDSGKYYKHLADYEILNTHKTLTVIFFEELVSDPKGSIGNVLNKLNIKTTFFDGYEFGHSNITQSHRNDWLQKIAIKINNSMEMLWLKTPGLKLRLLSIYRKINGAPKEQVVLSAYLRGRLVEYYRKDLSKLSELSYINSQIVDEWLCKMECDI